MPSDKILETWFTSQSDTIQVVHCSIVGIVPHIQHLYVYMLLSSKYGPLVDMYGKKHFRSSLYSRVEITFLNKFIALDVGIATDLTTNKIKYASIQIFSFNSW